MHRQKMQQHFCKSKGVINPDKERAGKVQRQPCIVSLTHNVEHIVIVWCITMDCMKDYARLRVPER